MNIRKLLVFLCMALNLSTPTLQAKCPQSKCCPCKPIPDKADYVIVGLGTAGPVVAKKLTDDCKTSVIALQASENLTQDPLIKFSEFSPLTVAAALFPEPPLYEGGQTTPQEDADDRILEWVLALPLGGASSINASAYCRGTDELYRQWEEIAGPLWSVERITRLYKELENYNGETNNPFFRGFHGPLNVFQIPNPIKVSQTFTQATINATGFPFVLDYNDPLTPIGASSQLQYTFKGRKGQIRVSSAVAFLNEEVITPKGCGVNGRKLRVHFESNALKVIWKGNKAIGVEYLQHGRLKQVYAEKGVIVCAGLKSSPFLLHSGVGPAALLKSLSIPVVYDNPNVGQGLADQPGIRILFTANPLDTPLDPPVGLFSQISWLPAPGGDPNVRALRLAIGNPLPGVALATFDLIQPQSRGFVSINSPDPLSPPVVDLGLLTNSADLSLLQKGFQFYIKNINLALQAIDPFYRLVYPPPFILDDLDLLTDFIKENIASNDSYQSHCRMAPLDQGGVVDSSGAVYGVKNLFVADDSIVPLVMDGSSMASAYLIGSNIADLLLKRKEP